jgi:Contractile injection system tube protein
VTVHALLRNQDDPFELACEFNPSSVKISKSASWHTPQARNAKDHPRPQFVGTGPQTMTLSLLFNAYSRDGGQSKYPVAMAAQLLLDWTQPSRRSRETQNPNPPTVEFQWGEQVTMTGFLRSVQIDYLLFDNDGTPLRATATVQMQSLPQPTPGTNPTSGGITGRRSAQTSEGDSLSSIAHREYGDPNLWRAIAIANDIDDPGRVPLGTRLLLPPHTQAAALASVGGDPR